MLFNDNNSIYRKYMLYNADLTADIHGTLRSLFLIYHNDPFMISDTPAVFAAGSDVRSVI